jgi:hypothetical protein
MHIPGSLSTLRRFRRLMPACHRVACDAGGTHRGRSGIGLWSHQWCHDRGHNPKVRAAPCSFRRSLSQNETGIGEVHPPELGDMPAKVGRVIHVGVDGVAHSVS